MSASGESGRGVELRALALLFLRLGATTFGGPAVHIAMMEDEVVRRRRWMTHETFLDLVGATNLIPGPNSTEMAIHIGRERAGFAGLVVAGVCFIAPAALISSAFAWAYVRWGTVPAAQGLLYGVKPVIVAVVGQALLALAPKAAKSRPLVVLGALALAATLAGADELLVLLGAGVLGALAAIGPTPRTPPVGAAAAGASALGLLAPRSALATAGASTGAVVAAGAAQAGLLELFLFFLKVGSVLYGSGYVLLAFLRADLVERLGWLTEAQLLDAVATGQVMPGPLFTTATFIGYVLGGGWGALLATLGIFLPGFVLVACTGPLIPRLRRSRAAGGFLEGVNVASLALMAAVTWALGRAAVVDAPSALLAVAAAVLVVRRRVNSTWLVLGGGAIGLALRGCE